MVAPESERVPLHPPEAAQELAFAEVQLSVEVAPNMIVLELVPSETVGARRGAGETAIVVVAAIVPPGPAQRRPNEVVVAGETNCEPFTAFAPLHPP